MELYHIPRQLDLGKSLKLLVFSCQACIYCLDATDLAYMSPYEQFDLIDVVIRHPMFGPEAVCYLTSIICNLSIQEHLDWKERGLPPGLKTRGMGGASSLLISRSSKSSRQRWDIPDIDIDSDRFRRSNFPLSYNGSFIPLHRLLDSAIVSLCSSARSV